MSSDVQDWATTAAGNNTGSAPDYPVEGQTPSSVNDTMREMMSAVARWLNDTNGTLTSTGSSNTYALTTNRSLSAYADGDTFLFEANHTNTGAATLNCDTVGAIDIEKKGGDALVAGDIVSGGRYIVVYDSTATTFHLLNPTLSNLTGSLLHTDGTDRVTPTAAGADIEGAAGSNTTLEVIATGAFDPVYSLVSASYGSRIYLDETNGITYIRQTAAGGALEDVWITLTRNNGVALYYDNEVREVTTPQGITVTGASTANVIARVESEGGYDPALQLSGATYGARAYLDDTAGRFYLRQTAPSGTLEDIWMFGDVNGATSLCYDGIQKLATTTGGATIAGTLNATTSLTVNGVAALLAGGELNDLANADKSLVADPGYYTFPGGFTVQWGKTASTSGSTGSIADTFATAFTTLFQVVPFPVKTGVSSDHSAFISASSTTGFTVTFAISGGTAHTYSWVAFGYKA